MFGGPNSITARFKVGKDELKKMDLPEGIKQCQSKDKKMSEIVYESMSLIVCIAMSALCPISAVPISYSDDLLIVTP